MFLFENKGRNQQTTSIISMVPIIEARQLSFTYGDQMVLQNINLAVHKGDFLGLIGPNGSGKSTLLKLLLGALQPTSGYVHLCGQPVEVFNKWSKIGYVPQKANAFNTGFPATVWEVVATGRLIGKSLFSRLTKEDKKIIAWALEQVDLQQMGEKLVGSLSGGQQQRVFIAQALASQPEILILDEPTAGVDAEQQENFHKLLRKLNREMGLTVLLVSHDLGIVTSLVSKVVCLNRTLYFQGETAEFQQAQGEILLKAFAPGLKVIPNCH